MRKRTKAAKEKVKKKKKKILKRDGERELEELKSRQYVGENDSDDRKTYFFSFFAYESPKPSNGFSSVFPLLVGLYGMMGGKENIARHYFLLCLYSYANN